MAQQPAVTGVRIKTPFDKSFTEEQMKQEAQRLRDHGARNVTIEKDPATGGWIISADHIPPE
jgi:hypothetical protein